MLCRTVDRVGELARGSASVKKAVTEGVGSGENISVAYIEQIIRALRDKSSACIAMSGYKSESKKENVEVGEETTCAPPPLPREFLSRSPSEASLTHNSVNPSHNSEPESFGHRRPLFLHPLSICSLLAAV